jgi:hypothetical protein
MGITQSEAHRVSRSDATRFGKRMIVTYEHRRQSVVQFIPFCRHDGTTEVRRAFRA